MNTRVMILLGAIAALVMMGAAVSVVQGQEEPVAFHESFDIAPAAPQPFALDNWDVQYHSREPLEWAAPRGMNAHHGPNCEAPMTTHWVDQWLDSVFYCANHVMTASNGDSGYALTYLTPDHMVDLSGDATISFDISTHSTGYRDWFDVWITPYEQNMARPFRDDGVDLHGPPERALQIELGTEMQICVEEYINHQDVAPGPYDDANTCRWWETLDDIYGHKSAEQRARDRETITITISGGIVTVETGGVILDEYVIQGEAFDKGVVQFGHHSYTPSKGNDNHGPNTWHWDEVHIEPAIPFTMIKSDTEMVGDDANGHVVTFDSPAPVNSHLRFAAVGNVEVSIDGGAYEPAQHQPISVVEQGGFAKSYWHPVPEGAQQVAFRLSGGWGGSTNMARDLAIWSQSDSMSTSTPTPTATPTDVPTATATPTPEDTATPTPQPTSTPTPEPTATATSTPESTATPTPEPVCRNAIYVDDELTKGPVIPCS